MDLTEILVSDSNFSPPEIGLIRTFVATSLAGLKT
jgi:hypothetical protein